jgi:hypothetical protein
LGKISNPTEDGGQDAESPEHPGLAGDVAANLLWHLDHASSVEEWNAAVSWLLGHLLQQLEGTSLPSLATGTAWRGRREALQTKVYRGFKPRRGRARDDWTALQDTFLLSMKISMPEAVRLLASSDGITEDAARKRLERAEKRSGIKLPRQPTTFGQK